MSTPRDRAEKLVEMLTERIDESNRDQQAQALLRLLSTDPPVKVIDRNEVAAKLKQMLALLKEENVVRTGQLVVWKPGCKNKRRPSYGEPVIVIDVLDQPVYDTSQDAGSTYFREPLDLIIGFIDEDDDFIQFHMDKRRFKPFEE